MHGTKVMMILLFFPVLGVLWAFQHVKNTIIVCNLKGRTSPRGKTHSNQFNFDLSLQRQPKTNTHCEPRK